MNVRKILFQIHLWSGLVLALPFLVLGLTGALLVFDQDIDSALNAQRPPIASAGPVQSYDAVAAAALTGVKDMRVITVLAPEKAGAPAQVRLRPTRGRDGGPTVWVDPVKLDVLRIDPPHVSPFRWAHLLHGSFSIGGGLGRQLVGWSGVLMLVMGLSGLVLWWPKRGRWLAAFGVAKGAKGYRFHRDLHGAAGIWLWAAFVVVTFSGVYISFPQPMGAAVSSVFPGRDLRATPELSGGREDGGDSFSFGAVYGAARQAAPDASLISIAAPIRPGQSARVTLAQPGWREGAPSITVFVNQRTGEVMEVRDPRKYTPGEMMQAWQRPLHEGIGLGLVWKLLVFAAGLLPPLFVITGISMWLIKRNAKRRADETAPAGAAAEMPN
ncbi:MAG TPA: PepSY-associated TM helix domain-containing protein [Caulobacterales bacterium]|nr:PepSY-associated TM helix domain-containing protein [Caulobacterales bacterium]